MRRKASVVWQGDFEEGRGLINTESSALSDAHYFGSRHRRTKGTNPGELIAAAHAACFSMALSLMVGEGGLTLERIETHAAVTIEKVGEGFEITRSHLDVSAKIPGADNTKFQELASKAKAGCPVSKLLKAQITMDAKLES